MATWMRGFDEGDSVTRDAVEWDEVWKAVGYEPPLGTPAWYGLLSERPDLAPGHQHPQILGVYAENVEVERIGTASAWTVTIHYERRPQQNDTSVPPTQRPSVVDASHESVEVPTFQKEDGDPWINTAGDLIAGITRTENHWVFNVQKNVAAIPTWFLTYADAVNSDAVSLKGLGVSPHYLMLKEPRIPLNPTTETVGGIEYSFYPISFSLVYNPRTWITKVYNRGLYEINGDGDKVRITDDEGEPVDEPQFLDINGAKLPYPVNPANIVVLEGWNHSLKPFGVLPLT